MTRYYIGPPTEHPERHVLIEQALEACVRYDRTIPFVLYKPNGAVVEAAEFSNACRLACLDLAHYDIASRYWPSFTSAKAWEDVLKALKSLYDGNARLDDNAMLTCESLERRVTALLATKVLRLHSKHVNAVQMPDSMANDWVICLAVLARSAQIPLLHGINLGSVLPECYDAETVRAQTARRNALRKLKEDAQ